MQCVCSIMENGDWLCHFEIVSWGYVYVYVLDELRVVGGESDLEEFIVFSCTNGSKSLFMNGHELVVLFRKIKQI